ncbi:MAG TPA: antibiotic biosynthesis monooxygenase [Longimicrobiales bacterium]|nr:antibiotic biosynthesis monooxygenase [Longimicrobiales bacterium]
MSDVVSWNLQLSVQDGRLDDVHALIAEMVEATRQESGCLGYEWFLSADGSVCHISERYADSGATMVHLGNFGEKFAERFMSCFTPTGFHVYGNPSDDVRGVLDGLGASYLGPVGGFVR